VKRAALVLALLTTVGAWVADVLLLGVPWIRNTWASLAFFAVPLALLLAARGLEGSTRLKAAAWTIFLVGSGGYGAYRLLVGNLQEEPGIHEGALAPDFLLKDGDGKGVRLSDLADRGRVLLVFFRGPLCPICRAELGELAKRQADFEASRVTVLAVGPQTPEEGKAMGLPFPVLSDPGLEVSRGYGLFHEKGMLGKDVPRPATLLVDKDRRVRWIRTAGNIRTRPSPDEVFEALRK
jgi:peroxiredoxin